MVCYNSFIKTKAFVREHIFWPKRVVPYNTNSLEELIHMFEIIKYSYKEVVLYYKEVVHITATSVSNYYLICGEITASNNARTILFLLFLNGLIAN